MHRNCIEATTDLAMHKQPTRPSRSLSLSFAIKIYLRHAPTQALSIALSLFHGLLTERIQCDCIGRRISVRKTIEREPGALLNIVLFQSINWNWPNGKFITLSGFGLIFGNSAGSWNTF